MQVRAFERYVPLKIYHWRNVVLKLFKVKSKYVNDNMVAAAPLLVLTYTCFRSAPYVAYM